MIPRNINIYADAEDIEIAKAQGINLSEFFRNTLKFQVGFISNKKPENDKELIENLKLRIIDLSKELKESKKTIETLQKKIAQMEEKQRKETEDLKKHSWRVA